MSVIGISQLLHSVIGRTEYVTQLITILIARRWREASLPPRAFQIKI
jgi:hypothetical protein